MSNLWDSIGQDKPVMRGIRVEHKSLTQEKRFSEYLPISDAIRRSARFLEQANCGLLLKTLFSNEVIVTRGAKSVDI